MYFVGAIEMDHQAFMEALQGRQAAAVLEGNSESVNLEHKKTQNSFLKKENRWIIWWFVYSL